MTTRRLAFLLPALPAGRSRPRRPLLLLDEWAEMSLRAVLFMLAMLGLMTLLGLAELH